MEVPFPFPLSMVSTLIDLPPGAWEKDEERKQSLVLFYSLHFLCAVKMATGFTFPFICMWCYILFTDLPPGAWEKMKKENNWDNINLRDKRYHQVIHLVSKNKKQKQKRRTRRQVSYIVNSVMNKYFESVCRDITVYDYMWLNTSK